MLTLLNEIKQENKGNIPLFLSVDQEGGRVKRMPLEIKNTLSSRVIGDINNEKYSEQMGQLIGEEVSSFGFNLNFAPVLDIQSNRQQPMTEVIGL